MFRLDGKVAVVTGAGSGIGEAIAVRFATAGAVVWVADVNAESAGRVVEQIRTARGQAEAITLDVAEEESCQACARRVLEANGQCDVLVNNAGLGGVGTFLTTTADELDRLHRVNVRGVLLMTRALLPPMLGRRSGSIINIASIGGIVGVRDRLAYCATKFAVVGMTKCGALDHSHLGVRFNCICPGRVETPLVQGLLKQYPDPKQAYEQMSATQLLGRMAQPEEVAAAAHYLASDESVIVTGSALMVDSGWSAGK